MTSVAEETRASGLGARRPRIDASLKVTGRAAFAADVRMQDLLHARMVLSDHAHAKIVSATISCTVFRLLIRPLGVYIARDLQCRFRRRCLR